MVERILKFSKIKHPPESDYKENRKTFFIQLSYGLIPDRSRTTGVGDHWYKTLCSVERCSGLRPKGLWANVYLQEAINGRDGVKQDEEQKGVESSAGHHERPCKGNRFFQAALKSTMKSCVHECLTVPVAGLSEGLPFGENDGHNQILEGGHVEERGVLVVPDVLVVGSPGRVHALRETLSGDVTGAAGRGRAQTPLRLHSHFFQWKQESSIQLV